MPTDQFIIRVSDLSVAFRRGGERFHALADVDFEVAPGEIVGVAGPSGSGKTTLLNAIAGLLTPKCGSVVVDGEAVYELSDRRRTRLRNQKIGFIFQTYHLHPMLSVRANVSLPFAFRRRTRPADRQRISVLLEELGLDELASAKAGVLSSGQKQRVVAARALAGEPQIVLADEPTANLDEANAAVVLSALRRARDERGATVLLVAHQSDVLQGVTRTIRLKHGRLAQ